MLYINKILPFLLSPLFLAFVLFVITRWMRPIWRWLPWVFLFVLAMPKVADTLMFHLESHYPALDTASVPQSDMIVVLGGSLRYMRHSGGQNPRYELAHDADRFEAGIALFNQGLAPKIVFSYASSPWALGPSEGEELRDRAIARGVAPEDILLTTMVENTKDEAKAIARMSKEGQSIILVTSAYHMPRSVLLFEQAGVDFTPYPVDFRTLHHKTTFIDFVPHALAFNKSSIFMREVLGRMVYKMLG